MRAALAVSIAVVMLPAAGAPSEAAVFNVVAFGDSVTRAAGFDVGSGTPCNPSNPDSCGHVGRLAKSKFYNCNPSTCTFANRGKAGELTISGVTRFGQVLNEKPWDLVILMEGTNDLGQRVSVQTVEFNLALMAAKAKARDIATAQSSIIWFNPTVEKPNLAALNNAARKLRSGISGQASSAKRCFLDAWSQLCPEGAQQSNCFKSKYWKGGEDHVGHPNSAGYDLISQNFFGILGNAGLPGAAKITAPSGLACGKSSTISWQKESVAGTNCGNWFRVQISGAGGNRFDDWFQEGDVCAETGECTVVVPGGLSGGSYSVRVLTRNTRGEGPWTADEDFSIVLSKPKKVGKTFGPSGQFFVDGGLLAELEWKPVENPTSYHLEIASEGGSIILDRIVTGVEECSGNRCIYAVEDPLPTGKYTWRVRAENVCGGAWTEPTAFEVVDGPPTTPVTAPFTGRIFDQTPTFRWQAPVAASDFEIEDAFGVSTVLPIDEFCTGGTCRFTSASLTPGSYSWRVRAMNPLGQSEWSDFVAFEVADCDCFDGRAAGGSSFLLARPTDWNGDLVIWAHGSNTQGVKEIEDFGLLAQRQFDEGYALGTTSYSVTGWPLFKSKRDLEKIYTTFVARYGKPTNVYLAGESVGALVALAGVETAKLGNLVGALAKCGPLAGALNWEGVLDQRLAYDAICSAVAGAFIPGGPKGLPKPNDLGAADVAAAVNACTGIDKKRPDRTVEEKQRLRQLNAVTGVVDNGLQEAMQLATFGLSDLVRDKKKLKGRLPVGNEGVDYGSPLLNATIQRAKPEPGARAKLERFYQLTGDTGDTKVISLHTSLDPAFYVENQSSYADLAPSESLTTGIIRESKASHCGFNEVEELAAWRALTIWTGGGKKPKPKNLQKRCNGLKAAVGGTCRFDKRPKLDTLDSRIRIRP